MRFNNPEDKPIEVATALLFLVASLTFLGIAVWRLFDPYSYPRLMPLPQLPGAAGLVGTVLCVAWLMRLRRR